MQDQKFYDELQLQLRQSISKEFTINFKTDTRFTTLKSNPITLVDEADYFLIDQPLFKVGDKPFVGMTATTFKDGDITVEKTFIEKTLGVKIFDSGINKIIDTDTPLTKTTYQEFFAEGRCDWPKLVYCPPIY